MICHRISFLSICLIASISLPLVAQEPPERGPDPVLLSQPIEKVEGIGGFFFRAKDPKALARWYQDNLGVSMTPTTYEEEVWQQEAGPTVFAPFKEDTEYFGRSEQMWMVNFRVRDLDPATHDTYYI